MEIGVWKRNFLTNYKSSTSREEVINITVELGKIEFKVSLWIKRWERNKRGYEKERSKEILID